jgi:glutamate dehydrogenase/leucine dehydrogenase
MLDKLEQFARKEPELVLVWNDRETEARGWLVINTLIGGAAGGGTRMKKRLDLQEVLLLAKTMEIKFTVSGPPIGGAKSGIRFDPSDPRRVDVLRRWYRAILPMLKNCYGTGGDLNVDFVKDVIPATKELGILHPQEGILEGHLQGRGKTQKALRLSEGTCRIVRDGRYAPNPQGAYTVADLVSGYSVAESVLHYYRIIGETHQGKRAIIQGWGNVGASTGYYLARAGVNVVAIFDKFGGFINHTGFALPNIQRFLMERKTKKIPGYSYISFYEMNERFWNLPADVFVPAATSRVVTRNQVESMIRAGVELIACGANVPFADDEAFFGPVAEYADNSISVIPDFIANCGMARIFAYLMQDDAIVSDESIFGDVSETVHAALLNACDGTTSRTGITQAAFRNALRQLSWSST